MLIKIDFVVVYKEDQLGLEWHRSHIEIEPRGNLILGGIPALVRIDNSSSHGIPI
jgi:hypothetical protein